MTSTSDSILDEVLSERLRQISHHGHTLTRDDLYDAGQIVRIALSKISEYHMGFVFPARLSAAVHSRRLLVEAMALCCAEVERIDRAEARRG